MHDVFISYSHKDVHVADAICHGLEDKGIRCWYAPRNIQPGDLWADAIIQALEGCEVMVLVFSEYSNASRQVYREVDQAVSLGKAIIPFKCTPSDPSGSLRYYLSTLHWLDAVDAPLEKSICELTERVEGLLSATQRAGEVDSGANTRDGANSKEAGLGNDAGDGTEDGSDGGSGGDVGLGGFNNPFVRKVAVACIALLVVIVCIAVGTGAFSSGSKNVGSQGTQASETAESTEADATSDGSGDDESAGTVTSSAQTSGSSDSSGEAGDPEDYLYTTISGGIRLDRYAGPEVAKIIIPGTIDGLPVTTIGEKCFEDHSYIEEVVLPQTVTVLNYRSFYGCKKLTTINLPEGFLRTDGWVFAHTGLTKMVFPKGFESLGYGTFYGCSKLQTVELTEKVTRISSDTFRSCSNLQRVTIPAASVQIASDAFNDKTDVTLVGVEGSHTQKYARAMGLTFEAYA